MTHDLGLKLWRAERPGLAANHRVYVENIIEELFEPLYTKEYIKELKQEIMSAYYPAGIKPASEHAVIDSLNDIQVFSINEVELMGYDNNNCMEETVKEISSREQDPAQKEIWGRWGYDNTKWMKNTKQDPETLYVAKYEK